MSKSKKKSSATDSIEVGRLAFRQEGGRWVAYYAQQGTMDGAVEIGSINLPVVKNHPQLKQRFMDIMRDLVSEIIQVSMGIQPEWKEPIDAPEHEKAGSA